MSFSLNTFLVNISGLPFVFTKVRILLSVCKLKTAQGYEQAAKKDVKIL